MSKTGLDKSKPVLNGLLKISLYMGDDIIIIYGSSQYEAQRMSQIVSRMLREKVKESEGNIR